MDLSPSTQQPVANEPGRPANDPPFCVASNWRDVSGLKTARWLCWPADFDTIQTVSISSESESAKLPRTPIDTPSEANTLHSNSEVSKEDDEEEPAPQKQFSLYSLFTY
jgi:hypothetical protein